MALTTNNIQDILGRPPTPDEVNKYQNSSFDQLSAIKNQPQVQNIPTVTPTPVNPSATIDQPQQQAPQQDSQQVAQTPQQSTVNTDSQTLSKYQTAQTKVQDIDKELSNAYEQRRQQVLNSGGIVNEAQLHSLVAYEKEPLLQLRKQYVSEQSDLGKQYQRETANAKIVQDARNQQKTADYRNAVLGQNQQKINDTEQNKTNDLTFKYAGLNQRSTLESQKFQNQKSIATLKASLQGTNADVSPALAAAIQRGEIDASKITSRSIKIYNDLAKLGVDAVSSKLTASGRQQIVTQSTKTQTAAINAGTTLEKNMPLLIDLAGKVNVGDTPAINDAFIKGKAYTSSDPNVTKYVSILATVRSEYSNMIAKGGVATESTRSEAVGAIPAGLTAEQYTGLLDQLQTESKNIYDAAQVSIDAAKENKNLSQVSPDYGNKVVENTFKLIGVNGDMATSTAIESVGIDKVVNGIIKQEGGTPQGKNNPGNVKFANQPGATKGKTAPDGGNYADFSTPEAGKKSVTDLVQKAARSGKSLSQFVAEYKGVTTNKEFDKGAGKTNVTPTAIEPKDIPDGYYQASDGLLYKK